MTERGRVHSTTYLFAGILPAIAIVMSPLLIFGVAHKGAPIPPIRIVVTTLSTTAAMVWAAGFATLAFRRMDEYFQAGSKFAWYWGGSLGLGATAPVYTFVALGGLHWLFPASFHLGADLFRAFLIGYALPVLGIALGYAIAAGVWRIGKR